MMFTVHSTEQALGCDEVNELDVANEPARARVAKSAQNSAKAQPDRSSMSVDLALYCLLYTSDAADE